MNSKADLDGSGFIEHIAQHEAACLKATSRRLPEMGVRAPLCWEALGSVLVLLDCAASCHWGCAQGDHRMEFLLGRAVNNAYAGLLLSRSGYYDQSLSMARSLGEAANLMSLFKTDRDAIERWKRICEKKRRQMFSPVKVRLTLKEIGGMIVSDEERYRQLSGYSIHVDPNALSQAHNRNGQAITYPSYQEAGFLLCLNELALPICFIAVFSSFLLTLPADIQKLMQEAGRRIAEQLGGIDVKVRGRPWFGLM